MTKGQRADVLPVDLADGNTIEDVAIEREGAPGACELTDEKEETLGRKAIALDEYYRLAATLTATTSPCSADDLREQAMAERLRYPVSEYERVLFVLGLAHWEAIKVRLSTDPSSMPNKSGRTFELVHLSAQAGSGASLGGQPVNLALEPVSGALRGIWGGRSLNLRLVNLDLGTFLQHTYLFVD